ncbi:MAG: NUDIX domain-containing protein [Rhodospirillales bacterium]
MTEPYLTAKDVEIIERRVLFQSYFRLELFRVRHRKYAGGWTGEIARELFERGHAAAALLYDPKTDRTALVEQFRVGALAAGRRPWVIEIVAGIIEDGETAEEVVRREAVEEAGVAIQELLPIQTVLSSPGGASETCALFCGRADLSRAGGIHGVPAENEETRVLVLPAADAFRLVEDGRVENAVCVVALQWLALNRDKLKRRWS